MFERAEFSVELRRIERIREGKHHAADSVREAHVCKGNSWKIKKAVRNCSLRERAYDRSMVARMKQLVRNKMSNVDNEEKRICFKTERSLEENSRQNRRKKKIMGSQIKCLNAIGG